MILRTILIALVPIASVFATEPPTAIVLGIADGASQELLTAARLYKEGATGRLSLEAFPRTAIVRTFSASDFVTDSAASATALGRGIKADNRVVGQATATSESAPPSLLDLAKRAGWSTAVITDDSVTGGTPAPFLVEIGERERYAQIAAKILDQLGPRADIILGGGAQWFSDLSANPGVKYKNDDTELVSKTAERLKSLPVDFYDSWSAFQDRPTDSPAERPILGIFYPDLFPYFADGQRNPRLLDMVKKTVEILKARKKPFLLVFEAALPDKAAHLNNAKRAIIEVLEFDETLAWLRENLGPNALILATADHNNGGFTINGPPLPIRWKGDQILGTNPVTNQSILTWASGPGFDRNSPAASLPASDPLRTEPALLDAKSSYHSGGDVWLLGSGPGSERVQGFLDNTDVYRLIADNISPP